MSKTDQQVKDEWWHLTCEFMVPGASDYEERDTLCKKRAIAVYVKADYTRQAVPCCESHRFEAINGGDGPVYDLHLVDGK